MKKRMNQSLESKIYLVENFSVGAYKQNGNIIYPLLLDIDIDPTVSPTFTFTITPPPPTTPPFGISIDPIAITGTINF